MYTFKVVHLLAILDPGASLVGNADVEVVEINSNIERKTMEY